MLRNNYFRFSIPFAFLFMSLTMGISFAQQEQAIQQHLNEGLRLRAENQYVRALEQFNRALLLNLKHDRANYLMASTYFDLGRFAECVLHCDKAIHLLSAYEEEAYLLKGRALIQGQKLPDAIRSFNKMLVEYPENHKAYYYMGVAYYMMNDVNAAESCLTNALLIKPMHAESHLLLGNMMAKKGENLKSVMALTHFLMIEPRGSRAKDAYLKLQKQLPKAFGSINTDISRLSVVTEASMNEFSSAEAMNAIVEGIQKPMDGEALAQSAQVLFDRLSHMRKESGFWWEFYVQFFNDMNYDKHLETLSYFISQSQNMEEIGTWLQENRQKVGQMIDWVNGYDRW